MATPKPPMRQFNFSAKPSEGSAQSSSSHHPPPSQASAPLVAPKTKESPTAQKNSLPPVPSYDGGYAAYLQKKMEDMSSKPVPSPSEEVAPAPVQAVVSTPTPIPIEPVAVAPTQKEEQQQPAQTKQAHKPPGKTSKKVALPAPVVTEPEPEPIPEPPKAVAPASKRKQNPPKRDDTSKGENIRASVIADQRADDPPGAHKTRIKSQLLGIERQEYFAAGLEFKVLEAAVRPPSFSTKEKMVEEVTKSASSLPFRFGSNSVARGISDACLYEFFTHMGSSTKATVPTIPTQEALNASTPEEIHAHCASATVARSTASDLYLAYRALTQSSNLTLTPLEQMEIGTLRQLGKALSSVGRTSGPAVKKGSPQTAHENGSGSAKKTKSKKQPKNEEEKGKEAATKNSISQKQCDVLMGSYRERLCSGVPAIYASFVEDTLAQSEKRDLMNYLLYQDLEPGYNLERIAEAEKEMCLHRLKDEQAKTKRKANSGSDEKKEEKKKPGAKRGRVADPVYVPVVALHD